MMIRRATTPGDIFRSPEWRLGQALGESASRLRRLAEIDTRREMSDRILSIGQRYADGSIEWREADAADRFIARAETWTPEHKAREIARERRRCGKLQRRILRRFGFFSMADIAESLERIAARHATLPPGESG